MRTDSTRVAEEAQHAAKQFIVTTYGPTYAPEKFNAYKSRGSAQDAHEAVRPTSVFREPDQIKSHLTTDQFKLYRLVWQRFVASQMKAALFDVITADIAAAEYTFRATGSTIRFDGFLRVYSEGRDDTTVEDEEKPPLPPMTEGQELDLVKLLPKQHFTEPPPRFTEATLVKTLEEQGIGRPSTYASIISTVQDRGYAELVEKKFRPTELGAVVTDLLVKHFPEIMSVQFTSGMEDRLDNIEEGRQDWVALMNDFYGPFAKTLADAETGMEKFAKAVDMVCPQCGSPMVEKFGRFGKFLSCSNYPECKYIHREAVGENGEPAAGAPAPVESDIPCPNCGRLLVEKRGRFGTFLGCPGYPECKYIHKAAAKSTGVACPECKEGVMVEKRSRTGVFYSCNRYPTCKFTLSSKPIGRPCPVCGAPLIEKISKGDVVGIKCSSKTCTHVEAAPEVDPESLIGGVQDRAA
jgi:DNA topoisomerase-1